MTNTEKLIMQMKLLRAEMKNLYLLVQLSKKVAKNQGLPEPRLDWTENAKTCMALDETLTEAGVNLWGDLPPRSEKVAHDTGDGWPETLAPQFLRNLGFEIV